MHFCVLEALGVRPLSKKKKTCITYEDICESGAVRKAAKVMVNVLPVSVNRVRSAERLHGRDLSGRLLSIPSEL